MTLKTHYILKTAWILLFLSFICFAASAEYVIVPYSEDVDVPLGLVNSDGADGTLTFWELPLKLQLIACFCFLSLSSFDFLKILPFLLGKVADKKGEKNKQKILSYVTDNPGCAEYDLLKNLGMKRGTFRYHAGKLELSNMLVLFRQDRFISYFRNTPSVENNDFSLYSSQV